MRLNSSKPITDAKKVPKTSIQCAFMPSATSSTKVVMAGSSESSESKTWRKPGTTPSIRNDVIDSTSTIEMTG